MVRSPGSVHTKDREEEAGERPRRARHLLAGRGTALPSRSRRGHRLAVRSHGSRRRRRLAARDQPSFQRATLSRDGARILRILAACRTSSGNVIRTQRVLIASGTSPIARNVGRTQRVLIASGKSPIARNVGRTQSVLIVITVPMYRYDRPQSGCRSGTDSQQSLSVRQDPAGQPAETDPLDGPYLNTVPAVGRSLLSESDYP